MFLETELGSQCIHLGIAGDLELALNIGLFGLKTIPLVRSRRYSAIVYSETLIVRTRVGTNRLGTFLIFFGIVVVKRRYNDSIAIDFVS